MIQKTSLLPIPGRRHRKKIVSSLVSKSGVTSPVSVGQEDITSWPRSGAFLVDSDLGEAHAEGRRNVISPQKHGGDTIFPIGMEDRASNQKLFLDLKI